MKARKPTIATPPALICAGLFFVVTGDTAAAHLVTDDAVTRFYERVKIAEGCRKPDEAMRETLWHTFRVKDARVALPAPSYEALAFYFEHYEGPAQDAVRALAARYITGAVWAQGPQDPGAHDRIAPKPKTPQGPAGNSLDALAARLEIS
jgi:hypothetical protein